MKPLVIYHANCADGFGAAWCFHHANPDVFDFHPGVYNDAPPDVTGRIVYLVDFSYPRDVLLNMSDVASSITVLDHHASAMRDLEDLDVVNVDIRFDMDRSGAAMAWNYLFPHLKAPLLLGHIEDRDLWRFKLPNTREVSAFVFSHDYTFEQWDKLMAADQVELLKMTAAGAAIERKHRKDVAALVQTCQRPMCIAGHTVMAASIPHMMASDAGHNMSAHLYHPFAATYYDTDSHRVFSLRSSEEGYDVSEVAAHYGGGGHKHAAGFRVPRDHELARS